MEITYKTSKSGIYFINKDHLEKVNPQGYSFNLTTIIANSTILDSDIIVVTHGYTGNNIFLTTTEGRKVIKYHNIAKYMKNYYPSLKKVELICCYNSNMLDTIVDGIYVEVPNEIRTNKEVKIRGFESNHIVKTINILLEAWPIR